jgi:acyl-CoA reductase-like NAD-dependent aldehyde dehydrogenase
MSERVNILKTYKLYINGAFPRTESGRYFIIRDKSGNQLANMCRASRKDFRNSVVAARKAFNGWMNRSAYNRGQILYRIAEMMEGRKSQFIDELVTQGYSKNKAQKEVEASIDRFIYYAGWSDKYQQVFGTVNPVASAHFNFSMPEPTGVVVATVTDDQPLISLSTLIAATIVGGNTCVILASEYKPITAITLAEVLNSSDVPAGVVNILTGYREELISHFSSHMDVNSIWYTNGDRECRKLIQENASKNVKRVHFTTFDDWTKEDAENPYLIQDFQEIKTTWHPVGI